MRVASLLFAFLIVVPIATLSGCAGQRAEVPPQARESEQQQLIDKARIGVVALRSDRTLAGAVNDALDGAWGVLIFPNLLKAGFVFGAGGGAGVLLGHAEGGWSDPAFYFTGEGSFGLLIGAEASQVMFVVRNRGALEKILNGIVNLGA